MLSISLEDSKNLIQENEIKHIGEIQNLTTSYDRQLKFQKILKWSFFGLAIGEAVYIVIDIITEKAK